MPRGALGSEQITGIDRAERSIRKGIDTPAQGHIFATFQRTLLVEAEAGINTVCATYDSSDTGVVRPATELELAGDVLVNHDDGAFGDILGGKIEGLGNVQIGRASCRGMV